MQLIKGTALILSLILLFACGGSSDEPTGVAGSDNSTSDEGLPPPVSGGTKLIAAEGGPVFDVPSGTMSAISDFDVNKAGRFVYVGNYESGGESKNAIWTGSISIEDQRLLLSTGDPIEGLESNAGYGNTYLFSLASDGSIAHISNLSGAQEGRQALVISNDETQKIVIKTGDTIGTEATLGFLNTVSASPYGAAFLGREGNSVYETLWLYDKEKENIIEIVRREYNSTNRTPPVADNNGCEVTYIKRLGVEKTYALLDDGSLVFEARASGSGCTSGTAIINYSKGQYHSIVSEGQPVPGTQESSSFSNIHLINISGGVPIISADLETPTGTSTPDSKLSHWAFPLSGEPKLIALEGEAVKLGEETKPLSRQSISNPYIKLGGKGHLALRITGLSDDVDNASLFGGAGYEVGQPPPSISAPGASALQYITSQTGALPEPTFKNTDYFSALDNPLLDSKGNLVFYGEITDHQQTVVTSRSIWRAKLDGSFDKRVKSGETINIGGVERTITSPGRKGPKGRENLKITTNDALIFKTSIEGSSRKALVYVDPPPQ